MFVLCVSGKHSVRPASSRVSFLRLGFTTLSRLALNSLCDRTWVGPELQSVWDYRPVALGQAQETSLSAESCPPKRARGPFPACAPASSALFPSARQPAPGCAESTERLADPPSEHLRDTPKLQCAARPRCSIMSTVSCQLLPSCSPRAPLPGSRGSCGVVTFLWRGRSMTIIPALVGPN